MKSLTYAILFLFTFFSILLSRPSAEASQPSSTITHTHRFPGLKETTRRMDKDHGERAKEEKGELLNSRRKVAENAYTEINVYLKKGMGAGRGAAYGGAAVATVAGHGSHRKSRASVSCLSQLSSLAPLIFSCIILIYSFEIVF